MRAGSCASASRATTASAGRWWPPAVNQLRRPGFCQSRQPGGGSHRGAVDGHRHRHRQPKQPQFNGGAFGNNSCWVIPSSGPQAGQAFCFATGPMECELTGLALTPEGEQLFLAVQHPGERHGSRNGNAEEARRFQLQLSNGESSASSAGCRWIQLAEQPQWCGAQTQRGADSPPRRPGAAQLSRRASACCLA